MTFEGRRTFETHLTLLDLRSSGHHGTTSYNSQPMLGCDD